MHPTLVALLIFTPLLVVKLSKSDGSQSIQALIIAERNAAEMIQQEETGTYHIAQQVRLNVIWAMPTPCAAIFCLTATHIRI